jgi:hypothetical protein
VSAPILGRLQDHMWIDRDDEGAIRLHSVARRWVAARDPNPQRTHQFHADVWCPRSDSLDLAAIRDREYSCLADIHPAMEAVFHLAGAGQHDEAWRRMKTDLSDILARRFAAHSVRKELLLEFFGERDEHRESLLSDIQAQGSLLNMLGNDLTMLGEPARGIPPLERAVKLGRDENPKNLAARLGNLAFTRILIGELRKADAELREQRSLSEAHDDRINTLVAMQEHVRLEAICGQYDAATAHLNDAEALLNSLTRLPDEALATFSPIESTPKRKREFLGSRPGLNAAYHTLVALLAGNDASDLARTAMEQAKVSGEPRSLAQARGFLGAALAATGETDDAREVLDDVLGKVRDVGLSDMEPELLVWIARTWVVKDRKRAKEFAQRSETQARRNGNRLQLADALLVATNATGRPARRRIAELARKAAWCDGPPFYYESVVTAAERLM